ncbi:MAG: hypothetical protein J5590_04595 [Clostridia bacterium]|nr:hypothetical protein [Clostridia bacterium]
MYNEDLAIYKGYLRGLIRQLKMLRTAIENDNKGEAQIIINELIEDTQNNIEDKN